MKRYIFTAFVLAAVVIGCTKSSIVDVPEVQKTPITFETYTGKTPVTKATEVTTAILEASTQTAPGFQVKAFLPSDEAYANPHMNEPVWHTTSGWEYDGTAYWPNDGKLNFVAYGLNAAINFNGSQTSGTYTVSPNVADQEDLIVAVPQNTEAMPSEGKVELIFKHLLTRIGFTLKTTDQNDVNVYIKKIVLNGTFYESCTVDLTAATPTVSAQSTPKTSYTLFDGTAYNGAPGEYSVFKTNQVPEAGVGIYANNTLTVSSTPDVDDAYAIIEGADALDRYMMLIPGDDVKPTSVEIIYQLAGAEDQHVVMDLTAAGVLPFTNFVAGKAYEFVIKLSTDAIEFDCAEIPGWGTATEVTPEAAN